MTQFTIHTVDTAPPDSRAALEALRQEVGFLPNLAATMAESPTLIEGFTTLRTILGGGPFTAVERETIAAVAFTTIANYAHNLTGCAVDQPFQPQVWTLPASRRRSA
jgi:hypothetical protein